jgi:hypothetical protein
VGRLWYIRRAPRRLFFHFYIFLFTNDTMAFPSGICICICVSSVNLIPAASQSIYQSINQLTTHPPARSSSLPCPDSICSAPLHTTLRPSPKPKPRSPATPAPGPPKISRNAPEPNRSQPQPYHACTVRTYVRANQPSIDPTRCLVLGYTYALCTSDLPQRFYVLTCLPVCLLVLREKSQQSSPSAHRARAYVCMCVCVIAQGDHTTA